MICSICKKGETSVVDSRPTEDGTAIRRRRLCVCGARFTTFDRVQYREIMVINKNGRKSAFDRDKLERSIRIALQKRPIQSERIEQMITGIVRRLESIGDTDIKSEIIGKIVMETLSRIDTVAYVRFASVYKNFQELGDFEDFMSELHPSKLEPKKTV